MPSSCRKQILCFHLVLVLVLMLLGHVAIARHLCQIIHRTVKA